MWNKFGSRVSSQSFYALEANDAFLRFGVTRELMRMKSPIFYLLFYLFYSLLLPFITLLFILTQMLKVREIRLFAPFLSSLFLSFERVLRASYRGNILSEETRSYDVMKYIR